MGRLNKIQLIGNLGDDVKMKYFEGENCVGNVSLATTEKYTNRAGEIVENTEWHFLVFRNKGAQLIEKWTKKGSKLFVEGRLKYRAWDDNGKTRYVPEIHVNEFEFLDGKTQGEPGGPKTETKVNGKPEQPKSENNAAEPAPFDDDASTNDDLPF